MSGAPTIDRAGFLQRSEAYLSYLLDWQERLPTLEMEGIIREKGGSPEGLAVLCVDVINGFCHTGVLASPRVKGIISPIARLFARAHDAGVRNFVLAQDTHRSDAMEFAQFPPHCIEGSEESRTVPELAALPFSSLYVVLAKNSISSSIGTGLKEWLQSHQQVSDFLVVGDCTDLCLYQLAMNLNLRSNALHLGYRIIVPADCVETYDLPLEVAKDVGAMPHDGDLLHLVFLNHMALNGVTVAATVE